ncbi:MAG: hypothetical protein ACQETR_11585 [Thermodesulfobacteriota bacterium]
MFGIFKKKQEWPHLSLDEIRKRARILVIDDSDFIYQPLFENDGYNIDKWDDVVDLQKLESGYFDIIFLDIQGVGLSVSKEQGLGILKHLRKICPTQIIIAYSNADFSLKYQDFFTLANATLSKSDDYVQFKRKLDNLLADKFSMGFYVTHATEIAKQYTNDIAKLKGMTENALLTRNTAKLKKFLEQKIEDKDIVMMILQVIQIGIGVAAI